MNSFVSYLNGLHNYNAQNQNAYGERNIESPFYAKTMVPLPICDMIYDSMKDEEPHMIILTGHAGDGKTSIMFQVLEKMGEDPKFKESIHDIHITDGNSCSCIKDFSELSDELKLSTLRELVKYPENGKYVFMVANTGPLINTFGKLFDVKETAERAQMQLIDAMDSNDGMIRNIYGYKIAVINMAAIDNTSFSTAFLDKIKAEELWSSCEGCPKKAYCHILGNRDLLNKNRDRAYEFIRNYYVWLNEYGSRLTIRSITEHLAYMITGGFDCENVEKKSAHIFLLSNLFFGFEGTVSNDLAENVLAVRIAKNSGIFRRRLRNDEQLLIRRNYKTLFGQEINTIIADADNLTKRTQEWDEELRRMYLFFNIVDEAQKKKDIEDIFSRQFYNYTQVRDYGMKASKNQKDLVIDALRMLYVGTVLSNDNVIPVTLGSESGITPSVQLVAGEITKNAIELSTKTDSKLNNRKQALVLTISGREFILTLPMMDYFEELKNGVIATNLDPQLSHGIENLKSMMLALSDQSNDSFDILVMNNNGKPEKISVFIEDDKIKVQ